MEKFILVLLVFFTSLSAAGQTSEKTDEEQIKNLIKDSFQDLLSDMKMDKLTDYYTEDFILLENGEIWDNDIIRGYIEKAKAGNQMPVRENAFDFIEVKIEGDMAWVAYHNTATFTRAGNLLGEMNWLESATAIRTKDGWRLQMLHSTVVEKEKP